jgi:hypothetical protein
MRAAAVCRPIGLPIDPGPVVGVGVSVGAAVGLAVIGAVGVRRGVRVGLGVRVGPNVGKGRSVAVGPIGRGVAVGAVQAALATVTNTIISISDKWRIGLDFRTSE